MKIAIISINYAPEPTGISVYTTGMAEYLAQRGMSVTVHTGFPYYPQWRKAPEDERAWHRREHVNSVAVRRNYLYVPSSPSAMKRMLHELSFVMSASISYLIGPKADVTIIVAPPLFLGMPLALIAKLRGSATIFHVQDLQPDAAVDLGMLKRGRLTDMLFFIERMTYRLADRVSTISEGMRRKIIGKGIPEDKTFLFRNWANDAHIFPMDRNTAYRREWGLEGKFVVLYSGNMGVKQGLGTLLEAAALLERLTDVVFVIVGDGGEKPDLMKRAEDTGLSNVRFFPVQPFDRLGELLATADVSVIPQKKGVNDIVLPSKVSNIMGSQRPLVAAAPRDSEFARMVNDADCGIVVEPENPAQMAAAIERLHGAAQEREIMGQNGRRYMEQNLGYEAILSEFAERLRRLGS